MTRARLQILKQGELGWPLPANRLQFYAVMESGVGPEVTSALEGCARVGGGALARGDWVYDLRAHVGPHPHQNLAHHHTQEPPPHLISPGRTVWAEDRTARPWLSYFSPASPGTFPSGTIYCDGNIAFLRGGKNMRGLHLQFILSQNSYPPFSLVSPFAM